MIWKDYKGSQENDKKIKRSIMEMLENKEYHKYETHNRTTGELSQEIGNIVIYHIFNSKKKNMLFSDLNVENEKEAMLKEIMGYVISNNKHINVDELLSEARKNSHSLDSKEMLNTIRDRTDFNKILKNNFKEAIFGTEEKPNEDFKKLCHDIAKIKASDIFVDGKTIPEKLITAAAKIRKVASYVAGKTINLISSAIEVVNSKAISMIETPHKILAKAGLKKRESYSKYNDKYNESDIDYSKKIRNEPITTIIESPFLAIGEISKSIRRASADSLKNSKDQKVEKDYKDSLKKINSDHRSKSNSNKRGR